MATNQIPLYLDPGVGVRRYTGTDTIYHNLTDNSGNVLDLHKSGSSVISVSNDGMLTVGTIVSPVAETPSLDVWGRPDLDDFNKNQILRLYDADVGESVLAVTKTETSGITGAWAVNLILRNEDTPQEADEALRITHDVLETTPTYPLAKLLSIGRTNDGGTYVETFKFDQGGDFHVTNDVLWFSDGVGDIGTSSDNRPTNIYAKTSLVVAGSSLLENEVKLGQSPAAAGNRTLTADINAGESNPYLRWDNSGTEWVIYDGTTESAIGTSNIASWDDLYDLDQTLTIDTHGVLTFVQTATTGSGFSVTRNLTSTSTTAPIMTVENQHATDDQPALKISGNISGSGTAKNVLASTATATAAISGGSYISAIDATVVGNASDSGGTLYGVRAVGTATGSATKYGFYADANWDYGLYSLSPVDITQSAVAGTGLYTHRNISSDGNTGPLVYLLEEGTDDGYPLITLGQEAVAGGYLLEAYTGNRSTGDLCFRWKVGGESEQYLDATNAVTGVTGLYVRNDVEYFFLSTQPNYFVEFYDNVRSETRTVINAYGHAEFYGQAVSWAPEKLQQYTMTVSSTGNGEGYNSRTFQWGSGAFGSFTQAGYIDRVGTIYCVNPDVYNAMYVTADGTTIGDPAGDADIVAVDYTSPTAGATGGIISLFKAEINADTDDTSGVYGIYVDLPTPANKGSGDYVGIYAAQGLTYGIWSDANSNLLWNKTTTAAVPLLQLQQDDEDAEFFKFTGTSASDESASISTGATNAYALRVEVYDGSLHTPLWIAAYNNVTDIDAATTWDGIYANDKTLDIDTSALIFTQTSTSGYGFTLNRNLAADSTDSPLVYINNQSATDDQPALSVAAAVSTSTALSALKSTLTASAAHTSGSSIGIESVIVPHADDTAGGIYHGFYATGSATGSATKYGVYADANWDYGVYSLSQGYFKYAPVSAPGANVTAFESSFISPGMSSDEVLIYVASHGGHASDTSGTTVYGFAAYSNPVGSSVNYGHYADTDWTYGVYSLSPVHVDYTFGSITAEKDIVTINGTSPAAGLGASGVAVQQKITYTPDSDDHNTSLIIGTWYDMLAAPPVGNSSAAILIGNPSTLDSEWGSGFFCFAVGNLIGYSGAVGDDTSLLHLSSNPSNALGASDLLHAVNIELWGDASDNASSNIYGVQARLQAATGGTATAFQADAGWDYGLHSFSPGLYYFSTGALPDDTDVHGVTVVSTGRGGDAFSLVAYSISVTDHSGDTGADEYTGIKIDSFPNNGSAGAKGLYVGSGWDYGVYSLSQVYTSYAFPVSSNDSVAQLVGTAPSAGLAAAQSVKMLNIDMASDADDSGSSFISGIQISRTRNDSAGIAYGLFIEGISLYNDTTVAAELTSLQNSYAISSTTGKCLLSHTQFDGFNGHFFSAVDLVAISTGTGLHQSDQFASCLSTLVGDADDASEARMYAFYAEGQASHVASMYGVFVDENFDYGVVSEAPRNWFQKQADSTVASTVVTVENRSTSATYGNKTLKVINEYDSATAGAALEIDHANTSTTEGTNRAIVLTSAKRNRRFVPICDGVPEGAANFYLYAPGTYYQWRTYAASGNYIIFPLKLPHNATLVTAYMLLYTGAGGTYSVAPTLYAKRYSSAAWEPVTIASQAGTTGTGGQSITISGMSHAIDNSVNSYFLLLDGGTKSGGYLTVLNVYVEYTLTDFSAACGW